MKTTAARICLAFNPSLYIWLCLLTMDVGRLVSTHPGLAGGQICTVPLRVAVQGPLTLLPFYPWNKFSWIWSQKVTGDLSWYIIISWWESPTIPRNVVRQFLSPLLKSRMQCVSVLLSLQLSANLQDFVVVPAIICRCNVVSVSYSYNLICICYKSIWAMWSSLYKSVWWNCDFIFFVEHSEGTWFAQFLWVLWSLTSG
jgi:hypothetical protein